MAACILLQMSRSPFQTLFFFCRQATKRVLPYTIWISLLLLSSNSAFPAQGTKAIQPSEFVVGRTIHTDVGPPMYRYELFVARPTERGSTVDRLTIIPPTSPRCASTARVTHVTATVSESPTSLLRPVNFCAISDRAVRRAFERRQRDPLREANAGDIVFQVLCGATTRLIPGNVLDGDFDLPLDPLNPAETTPRPVNLPGILKRLNDGVALAAPKGESPVLRDLAAGTFDSVIQGAPDKLSRLYRDSVRAPTVRLSTSTPIAPETFVLPQFPPLARTALVAGSVTLRAIVDENGTVRDVTLETGHQLLKSQPVRDAVNTWRFPKGEARRQVQVTLDFSLNCSAPSEK
jgi:hypothetical protein